MELQFDKNKNLQSDLTLTCSEFKQLFGYSKERDKLIQNLFQVADKLKRIGCEIMFVFGSFTTSEENPNDIDVCFDISNIDEKVLEKNYAILDKYERNRYRQYLQVHLPFFKINNDKELVKFMKRNRNGNIRGIVEVNLNDLQGYDKE